MAPALVLGIGLPDRGDDAAGLAVARRLRRRRLPGAVVAESAGEVSALLDAFQGRDAVIIVDASQGGRPPGTVRRLEAGDEAWLALPPGSSAHALGICEAIELARALGQLPARVVVYVIEGRRSLPGSGLSPEVEQAVRLVEERVTADLQDTAGLGEPGIARATPVRKAS